jgi:RNA polymerase sigma factor (sigma-70 family)
MWGDERENPALGAPGSNNYSGLIATSTSESLGANVHNLQVLSDEDANDLCLSYQPLAFSIAGQYFNKGIELDELRSAALLGLLKASRKFDPIRGVPFGAYAAHWIKGEVRALFKPKADAMGLGRSDSLHAPAFTEEDSDGNTKLDLVTDDSEPPKTVDLGGLTERERFIVDARLDDKTLDQIGNDLNISAERVRQLDDRGVEKVKRTKGNVARACIRDLLKRRGYKKPSRAPIPFRAVKYPCRSCTAEEIAAVSVHQLSTESRREETWWVTHRRSCLQWTGRTTSHYRFKSDGPRPFPRWGRK